MDDKSKNTMALSIYLVGLALLSKNEKTYVNKEIRQAIKAMQKELNLSN